MIKKKILHKKDDELPNCERSSGRCVKKIVVTKKIEYCGKEFIMRYEDTKYQSHVGDNGRFRNPWYCGLQMNPSVYNVIRVTAQTEEVSDRVAERNFAKSFLKTRSVVNQRLSYYLYL